MRPIDMSEIREEIVEYDLISRLDKLRHDLCCYTDPAAPCDCKYGYVRQRPSPKDFTKLFPSGEKTGCAELRSTIAILERILG